MILRTFVTLSLVVSMTASMSLAAEKLELDAEASKVGFVGKKADGQHDGGFKKFTSVAVADMEEPENGMLEIEIDAASLWADDEKLANHLKNPDFFDVRKYPKITFKSTGLIHGEEEGKVTIKGELTMLGKTVAVTAPCDVTVGEKKIEVETKFVIDRTLWGMTYGEGKVNKEVNVTASLIYNR